MSVCFIPLKKQATRPHEILQYRYIEPITLCCNVNIKILNQVIISIFVKCGDLHAYGYNRSQDEYWGKKIKKTNCVLHFKLKILPASNDTSCILIEPVIGCDIEIKQLFVNIIDYIKLFETSSFFKNNLEK